MLDLANAKGYDISSNYDDCGVLMFDQKRQDTHAGGSGCACSATVFSGYDYLKGAKKLLKVGLETIYKITLQVI